MLTKETPRLRLARPRLGFAGLGWIGQHRMRSILETGAIEVAAIADPSSEMRDAAGALAPSAACADSFDELLDSGVDGIVIATPSALHAAQSMRALRQGVAVLCQKPLGRTEAEVRSVLQAARTADVLLGIDFSYRATEGMRRIRERVASGMLGDVFAADLVFHNAYGPDKSWFYDRTLSGGGCLMDLGVHLIDLALWTLDYPGVAQVAAKLFAAGEPIAPRSQQVEDYALITLELDTGAVVRVACSWRLQAGCDAIIGAEFYGTKGGAGLHNVNGSFYDFVAEQYRGTSRETLAAPPDAWFGRAAAEWAVRLAAGERFDPEVERVAQVAEVLDRIYQFDRTDS